MLKWQAIELVNQADPHPPHLGLWMRTERAPVPGGWLVRTLLVEREVIQAPNTAPEPEVNVSVALTFVPDPAGAWKIS